MKTTTTLAVLLGTLIMPPAMGQQIARLMNELQESKGKSFSFGDERYDLVNPDYTVTTASKGAFLRIASRQLDGWAVRVFEPDGDLLMTGLYADEQLTRPSGLFTYYHSNGRMESTGLYINGIKAGVWSRYDTSGDLLGERIYHGLDTEGLLLQQRVATLASSH